MFERVEIPRLLYWLFIVNVVLGLIRSLENIVP
jgi:hypothetical protein